MYAITGITGQVGGALARTLLAAHRPVRAVLRNAGKAREWAEPGCEIALASMNDASALAAAFARVLGCAVEAQAVPRATWADLFRAQGTRDPQPRIPMLDGFNEGGSNSRAMTPTS